MRERQPVFSSNCILNSDSCNPSSEQKIDIAKIVLESPYHEDATWTQMLLNSNNIWTFMPIGFIVRIASVHTEDYLIWYLLLKSVIIVS